MTLREKEAAIINHYGVIPQLKYFQSEVFELNEAILYRQHPNDIARPFRDLYANLTNTNSYDIEHIAEEIADVQLMLNQFKVYYGISDDKIGKIMVQKADRQLERIKDECTR